MQHRFKTPLGTLLLVAGFASLALAQAPSPQPAPQPASVIIENVRIFNGTSDKLSAPSNVLVVGNVIKRFPARPSCRPAGHG